jgi:hypothetical protein
MGTLILELHIVALRMCYVHAIFLFPYDYGMKQGNMAVVNTLTTTSLSSFALFGVIGNVQ